MLTKAQNVQYVFLLCISILLSFQGYNVYYKVDCPTNISYPVLVHFPVSINCLLKGSVY